MMHESADRPIFQGDGGSRSGFTLIEVLAALTILGLVLIALLGSMGADLRTRRVAADTRALVAAGEFVLERISMLERQELDAAAGRWHELGPPLADYRWSLENAPVAGRPELVHVVVRVRGPETTAEVATRLFRPRRSDSDR